MSTEMWHWPIVSPSIVSPLPLWTVYKQTWRIDCTLQGREPGGWSIRVLLNGEWFFSCRFTSWGEATQAASDKYDELVTAGWVPLGGSERIH